MSRLINRRCFLFATAAFPVADLAGRANAAAAFTLEEPAAALIDEYTAARAAACSLSGSYHRKVLEDVRVSLDAMDLRPEEKLAIEQRAACPLCGCPVAG